MQRKFPRRVQELVGIFEFAAEFCAAAGVDSSTQWVIDLTLEELFTNVLKHSAGGEGDLLVELERVDQAVQIALTDFDADRFDPAQAPTPDTSSPIEQRTPGGLGLHLVRKMTDELRYEYNDRVSKTTVIKKLE